MGHSRKSVPELGAATAIRLLDNGEFEFEAETSRRGGGSAQVVNPLH
jgi:gamma-glutamyltranspeptidase/glutathione hydrolase